MKSLRITPPTRPPQALPTRSSRCTTRSWTPGWRGLWKRKRPERGATLRCLTPGGLRRRRKFGPRWQRTRTCFKEQVTTLGRRKRGPGNDPNITGWTAKHAPRHLKIQSDASQGEFYVRFMAVWPPYQLRHKFQMCESQFRIRCWSRLLSHVEKCAHAVY